MNLNTTYWKFFKLSRLFNVNAGKYYNQDDYSDGSTPYCSASAENNGVARTIDVEPDFYGNKIITGKVGCTAFFQSKPFCATSDVNVLSPKFEMSTESALFITTVINFSENFRWNYGRQCRVGDTLEISIKLPVLHDKNGLVKDPTHAFSDDGFIPDWHFMEEYIKNLHHKKITTKIKKYLNITFQHTSWKEFYLHRVMKAQMGNGIDAILTTSNNPKYNYVSRDSNGNGVVGFVDEIEGEEPFPAGSMSLALGGSYLGSCFIQKIPFYTAQNVAVLQEKLPLTDHTKLFISTIIRKECKVKFQAFGRELNAHYKNDFTIKLPVLHDKNGIVKDPTCEFSDDGFIPDWQWMDDYMRTLPFSDRI